MAQRRVIPAMKALEACEIGALMVRDLDRARGLAEQHGVPRCYDNADELIGDSELDAVYISSPPNLHREQVEAAARAGKHVLCEKPMALSVDECRRMMDACDAAGVHLQVCFVLRGWPTYGRVREMLASGELGQVV